MSVILAYNEGREMTSRSQRPKTVIMPGLDREHHLIVRTTARCKTKRSGLQNILPTPEGVLHV